MDLVGVWKRIKLEEPKGILGPKEEQYKTVLWIQGECNLFIDIRIFPEHEIFNPMEMKSFAGEITNIDQENQQILITWNRRIDYRPLGPPDVGLVNFLSEDLIEEDGVLEGDDYKEIWQRIMRRTPDDVSAKIFIQDLTNNQVTRVGYFIIIGNFWALTLSRSVHEQLEFDQRLSDFFKTNSALCDETSSYLSQYLTIGGNVVDEPGEWIIDYSLHKEMIGMSIASPELCNNEMLSWVLHSLDWDVQYGHIPPIFSHWKSGS